MQHFLYITLNHFNWRFKRSQCKNGSKIIFSRPNTHGLDVCESWKERVQNDPEFIKNCINGDETCVYGYGIKTDLKELWWHRKN